MLSGQLRDSVLERSVMFAKKHGDASVEWGNWPVYILFFLMIAFPGLLSLLYVKAFLFALLLALIGIQGLTHLRLHPTVVLWTAVLAVVSLVFGLRGLFLGTPGASKSIQVYVLWPIVYLVLLSGVRSTRVLHGLERTLVFSSVFIGLFGTFFSLSELNILPQMPYQDSIFASDDLRAGFNDGGAGLSFPGINSLAFLFPFLIAASVVYGAPRIGRPISRRWLLIALLLNLPLVLLSGRRGIQLVVILAPFLTLALGHFQPPKERLLLLRSLRSVVVGLVLLVALAIPLLNMVYGVTYQGVASRFSEGFDFSSSNQSDSATGRIEQYVALMNGWAESPLIGKGLGASANISIRSELFPWSYELYYVALLFQTGLLGFAAYTAGIAWIFWSGIMIIKRGGADSRFMIPVLVGTSAFLIAAGTNPYLAAFDGIWVIFLPLGFINHRLLTHDQADSSPSAAGRHLGEQS
jgi:O-antigen ligase